jgi:hypothetical protein
MRKLLVALEIVTALSATATMSMPARADDVGRVAAGVAGGVLGGLLLGGALAPRPYPAPPGYYGPGPAYYDGPAPRCYWTRGEPYWDEYVGAWRRPRIRVCD